ncbi:MAG: diacylglycerol kinase family protein, partial [Aquiluna sp.]
MKPLGVIINPAANRGRGNSVGEKALAAFQQAGIQTINLSGASQDYVREKVRQKAGELSGLVAMEQSLPLGLVPAGSGNDQVRELAISLTDTEAAVANIVGAIECPRAVDVMWVETDYRQFWSLGSISAGFDALCAERANRLVWPKGPNSYVAALFLELPRFKPIKYSLTNQNRHNHYRLQPQYLKNYREEPTSNNTEDSNEKNDHI